MPRRSSSERKEEEVNEYTFDDVNSVSSAELLREDPENIGEKAELAAAKEADDKLDPISSALEAVSLPQLKGENRAWLQMQSPTRLFFYWSTRTEPIQTLSKVMGDHVGSYTLVAKLIDLTRDTEEIHRVESAGSMWFNVDAQTEYRAEIGFYAPNQPFVRVMFSNVVATPRKKPSPHPAADAEWATSSERFARVLDATGFSRDAFEVAVAGDDTDSIDTLSHRTLSYLIEVPTTDFAGIASDEIRRALYMIASGEVLENFRWRIDASLFAVLQRHVEKLSSDKAMELLREQFGIDQGESAIDDLVGPAVFGSSRLNMPKRSLRRRSIRSYKPISSIDHIVA